ncbi:hypothetical protein HDU83_009059 [Entophlyctis luteolus]|nr:hypothetical protein HDU83_009059 [Entophlyctis luteolus]
MAFVKAIASDALFSETLAAADPAMLIALTEFIDKKQIECLNQSDEHTVFSIFGNDPKQYLESDVDEQLIIVIPFNQMVKVHSLKITGPKGNAPSTIKTYINRPVTLSFEEADAVEAVEVIDVTPLYQPDSVAATEQSSSSSTAAAETITAMVPLRFVKYQNVSSLTVFVGQNVGRADTTVVNKVVVYGSPVESTKSLSELKKDGHEH